MLPRPAFVWDPLFDTQTKISTWKFVKPKLNKRLLSWVCFGRWSLQTFLLSACYVWTNKQNIFQLQTVLLIGPKVKRSSDSSVPEVDCVYTTALQEFVLYSCLCALPGQESQAGLSWPKLEVLSASTGYNSCLWYFISQYRLFFHAAPGAKCNLPESPFQCCRPWGPFLFCIAPIPCWIIFMPHAPGVCYSSFF